MLNVSPKECFSVLPRVSKEWNAVVKMRLCLHVELDDEMEHAEGEGLDSGRSPISFYEEFDRGEFAGRLKNCIWGESIMNETLLENLIRPRTTWVLKGYDNLRLHLYSFRIMQLFYSEDPGFQRSAEGVVAFLQRYKPTVLRANSGMLLSEWYAMHTQATEPEQYTLRSVDDVSVATVVPPDTYRVIAELFPAVTRVKTFSNGRLRFPESYGQQLKSLQEPGMEVCKLLRIASTCPNLEELGKPVFPFGFFGNCDLILPHVKVFKCIFQHQIISREVEWSYQDFETIAQFVSRCFPNLREMHINLRGVFCGDSCMDSGWMYFVRTIPAKTLYLKQSYPQHEIAYDVVESACARVGKTCRIRPRSRLSSL